MSRRPGSRRALTKCAVAVATLVALLFALEIGVRVFAAQEPFSFRPVFARDPVCGYRLKPDHAEYAFGAEVRSNAIGFRGPAWTPAKSPGAFRVALLGDSHAFGFGVELEHTVGEVVASRLARRGDRTYEVLNFGLPGYTSRQNRAVLEHIALGYDPDVVVIVACENDDWPELWVDDAGYLRAGRPKADPAEASRLEAAWLPDRQRWGVLRYSRLVAWAKLQVTRWRLGRAAGVEAGAAGFLQPVDDRPMARGLRDAVYADLVAMIELCRAREIPVVVALFAARQPFRRMLRDIGRDTGVPTLELLSLFPEVRSWADLLARFSLGWDPHLGVEAHRRWASALVGLLERKRYLPP